MLTFNRTNALGIGNIKDLYKILYLIHKIDDEILIDQKILSCHFRIAWQHTVNMKGFVAKVMFAQNNATDAYRFSGHWFRINRI